MNISRLTAPKRLPGTFDGTSRPTSRRNMYAWLLLALLLNFACIFAAVWLGLSFGSLDSLEANILARSTADYNDTLD
ncbi:MAG: hypothetical protein R3D55_28660, partial [Chloroflexota bacterium]